MEIDRKEVVLVRFKAKRRGKPLLEAHAVRPMPEDVMPSSIFDHTARSTDELTARLREMFELTGTRPGRISLVIPDNLAKISLLTLPGAAGLAAAARRAGPLEDAPRGAVPSGGGGDLLPVVPGRGSRRSPCWSC